MFVDTHCHIHDRETFEFARSRQQISKKTLARRPSIPHNAEDFEPSKILKRARAAGVTKLIVIGTSIKDSQIACDFAKKHENVFWTYGIHPDNAGVSHNANLPSYRPVAIGEIGLDYRNGASARVAQIRLLEQMLELAKNKNLPCIFHVRDAFDDFWPIVDNSGIENAVVHSFSDSGENLEKALGRGFYIGVNGLATFADLPTPPLDRTLLETDAPFLAPVPVRGHVNEPAYIPDIAQFLSEKHQVPLAEIAKITTKNAEDLFDLSQQKSAA